MKRAIGIIIKDKAQNSVEYMHSIDTSMKWRAYMISIFQIVKGMIWPV